MYRSILPCLSIACASIAVAAAAGCDRAEPGASNDAKASATAAKQVDGHGHAHGAGGHDHSHDHDAPTDTHAGPKHPLGTAKVGGFEVAVTQVGAVRPGEGATFEIRPAGAGEITAVRAWVGVEFGQGSVKAKAPRRGDFYDADLEVPAQLPAGCKVWVEIETPAGKAATAFELANG